MKITYLAHASFLITADDGIKIITDPYTPGEGFMYAPITETADIVTVSHDHGDHNNTAAIGGNPAIVTDSTSIKGISITAVATAHDDTGGSQRGKNMVMCFDVSGVKVVHLGDLGHLLTDDQAAAIGQADVLLIPVGGNFTIDAVTATKVAKQVEARVIIPMHYKTDKCKIPIAPAVGFVAGKSNVTYINGSEVEFTKATLPADAHITVLDPSK